MCSIRLTVLPDVPCRAFIRALRSVRRAKSYVTPTPAIPGASSGSSATLSTRVPFTNTRGLWRRSDSR